MAIIIADQVAASLLFISGSSSAFYMIVGNMALKMCNGIHVHHDKITKSKAVKPI